MMRPTLKVLLSTSVLVAACGKGGSSSGGAPPAQPADGAPVAFEVTGFTPGAEHDGKIEVKGYNFSDKTLAAYTLAARFTDASGAPLKVGVGTPFEKDNAWTSMSGRRYMCKPKSWCSFEIEMIEVPAATKKAEVALTGATAVGADGMAMEQDEVWKSPKGMADWPL
ncbi:MAG TPA: hypothetical protein VHE35_18165 [Kofleriaceae bacterium]|nr:hypothetical protein [Kofleriaceae bacterium]